jgi:predicted nucleic acid-binding protein
LSWYIDSSAILSVILKEPDGLPLESILGSEPTTSRLSQVEVLRRVTKFDELLIPRARLILAQFQLVHISESILNRAENYSADITVKAADAIHLATAETLAPLINGIITLDTQMAKNARKLNLVVW